MLAGLHFGTRHRGPAGSRRPWVATGWSRVDSAQVEDAADRPSKRLIPYNAAKRLDPARKMHCPAEMIEHANSRGMRLRGVAAIAAAAASVAIGAFAVGALVVGRLAIRRLVIDGARIKSLEIEKLTIKDRSWPESA